MSSKSAAELRYKLDGRKAVAVAGEMEVHGIYKNSGLTPADGV